MTSETTTGITMVVPARQSKRGFTLTEIAIVLGIIGLILGAIWVAAAAVYNNQKIGKANTELLAIAQSIKSLYATQTQIDTAAAIDETDPTKAQMVRAGVFPTDALSTGNPATAASPPNGPWPGSTIKIFSATTNNTGDSYEILFVNIPQAACISLLTAASGTGRSSDLVMATAQTTAGTDIAYTPTQWPVNVGDATTACSGPYDDAAFQFTLR